MSQTNLCLPENPDWIPKYRNVGEFILENIKLHKSKIAQIDAESGKSVTYEVLLAQIISVAKEMKKHGLKLDDVISVCSYNSLENILPVLASFLLGVKPASLDPSLSLDDTIYLTNMVKPKMIFCVPESLSLIENMIDAVKLDIKIVVFGNTDKYLTFSSFLNDSFQIDELFIEEKNQNIDDVAMIMFSSGTTGAPKAICLTHYGLLFQTHVTTSYRSSKIWLAFSTLYWISSIILNLSSIFQGATRIVMRNFQLENCLKAIEMYKVPVLVITPTASFVFTQNSDICKKYNLSSLKFLSLGGAHLGETQYDALCSLFPNVFIYNMYGMTEISGAAAYFHPLKNKELRLKNKQSVGVPIPGIHLKVIDLNTQKSVGPNEAGELRIKTRSIFKKFYNNNIDYHEQFDEDGYFYTGDIVYYNEYNCLYIVDRQKHMLKFQCWQISPVSIETILLTHPNVKEAIVVGKPDEKDGEHPLAVIVVQQNCILSPNEIIEYTNEKVSNRQMLRGGIKFIEKMPKTPSGKIQRQKVRQMIIRGDI